MRAPYLSLTYLLLITLIIACSKDTDAVGEAHQSDIEIEFRDGFSDPQEINCVSLITNGDFEDNIWTGDLDDCNYAFQNGLVPDWTNAMGSPDLWFEACQDVPFLGIGCVVPSGDFTQLARNSQHSYTEGILTNVSLLSDPDVFYSLFFDARNRYKDDNGEGLEFVLTSGFTSSGSNPSSTNNIPTWNSTTSQIIYSCLFYNISNLYNDYFPSYKTEFIPDDTSFDQLVIYSIGAGLDPGGIMYLDNIEIYCHSDYLEGITIQDLGDCKYKFSADLGINIVEYTWNFGDGVKSEEASPIHIFSGVGPWTVTLTIEDDRGCCTMVETVVV